MGAGVAQSPLVSIARAQLSCNNLTDDHVLPITAGDWPLLATLNLSANKFTTEGVKQLVSLNG